MSAANDNPEVIEWSHIELSAGTVTSCTIEGAEGVRQVFREIGKFKFYIEAVDTSGARLGLNSCEDYETAIRLSEAARVDLEIDHPVRDTVAGSH